MRIVITSNELQEAIKVWLESKGLKSDAGISFSVEAVGVTAPSLPVTPIQPIQVPIVALQPGRAITVDPPLSATVEATNFGFRDPGDNGIGFFTNPVTGAEYRTNNATLIGASLPREVLLSTFLKVDDWRTSAIAAVWKKYAARLRQFVLINQPLLTIDSQGNQTLFKVPLVDAGPTASAGNVGDKNGLDVTEAAKVALKTGGKAVCTYCIELGGALQEIRGWDFKAKKVG